MKNTVAIRLFGFLVLPTILACNSGSHLNDVAGIVNVDGKPVESGTIHFQSNTSSKSSGGATVTNGSFRVATNDRLEAGEYAVVVQAYRKTGRIFNDPQKGKVEVTEPIQLKDSPQTVQLSAANAQSLSIECSSASK